MANLVIIRDLCEDRRMTIRELAKKIGRDESSIQSAIRRGSTHTATLELIAKALSVSPGMFFDGYHDEREFSDLQKEIDYLRTLLKEKERTIEILMSSRK